MQGELFDKGASADPQSADTLTDHDCWGTPPAHAAAIVANLPKGFFSGGLILEPSAGKGGLIDAVLNFDADIDPRRIIAIEPVQEFYKTLTNKLPIGSVFNTPFEAFHLAPGNFLTPGQLAMYQDGNVIALANPPYRQGRDLAFIEKLKTCCKRFAAIMPLGLLEPACNRSLSIPTAKCRSFRTGLCGVYPMRRISFVNLLGGPENKGQRPTAVFYFQKPEYSHPLTWEPIDARGKIMFRPPWIDYSIQDYLDANA